MLARVPLSVAPDALAIAGRLADRPGLVALVDGVGGGWAAEGRWSFVACDPDEESSDVAPPIDPALPDDPLRGVIPRWVGVIPYEARRAALERPTWTPRDGRDAATLTTIRWARYPAVVAIDHRSARVVAIGRTPSDASALARWVERGDGGGPDVRLRVIEDDPPEAHVARVRAALEAIVAGDVYQINLARRLRLAAPHLLEPREAVTLGRRLLAASPSPFGAVVVGPEATFVSTSPELLLDARALPETGAFGALRTDPIKGTRPRRVGAARELDGDAKERAELAMIIDVERNDLGRVARVGSVRVIAPRVVRAGPVLHRVAQVRAVASAEHSREQVILAIVPSGSVTGAPKVRAMELIATLEPMRRGLYTGGFGLQAHDGSVRLGMAIRTAVFPAGWAGEGEWLVGGGIVEASDPERELDETRWKSRQLSSVIAG